MTAFSEAKQATDGTQVVRGPLTITIDDGEFIEPRDGAWYASEYLRELRSTQGRRGRLICAVTRIKFWVFEARILPPEGQTLEEFGEAMTERTGEPLLRDPQPGDRAVYLCGSAGLNYFASHALSDALGFIDRMVGDLPHGPAAVRVRRADLPHPSRSEL